MGEKIISENNEKIKGNEEILKKYELILIIEEQMKKIKEQEEIIAELGINRGEPNVR